MPTPLVIGRDTRLRVVYESHRLSELTREFVSQVAANVISYGDLEEAVLRAVERFPDASHYFDIEVGNVANSFGLRAEYLPVLGQRAIETRPAWRL